MPQQIIPSTATSASAVVGNDRSGIADDHSEAHESMLVSDLKKEIVQLRGTVHQLQAKVEFLLSFVGIELTKQSPHQVLHPHLWLQLLSLVLMLM